MFRAALACVLLSSSAALADIGPLPPARPPPECRADSECVITTFEGCCGSCCPRAPYAVSASGLKAAQQRCAAVRCKAPSCDDVACAMVVPEPASSFRAVCQAGRCVARRVSEVAECRSSADCTVVTTQPPSGAACYASPCGCCPVNAAVPVEQLRPRPAPQPAPPLKKGEAPATAPPFGLSTGDGRPRTPPVDPPNCSPCPSPPPADAACVAGKCTLAAPKPLPRPRPIPPG